MINIIQPILKEFVQSIPKTELVFAYGSAVQTQAGYNYEDVKQFPMIDLIIAVDDIHSWHQQNIHLNKHHYSGLGYYLGASFIQNVSNNIFPINFSPFIRYNGYKIKYGIVSSRVFIKDLENWNWLSLAGRMQKPVLEIQNDFHDLQRLNYAINQNYIQATAISALTNFKPFLSEQEFLYNIVALSYIGDIRFNLGGENHQKVANILKGNYSNIQAIYKNILLTNKTLSNIMTYDRSYQNIIIKINENSRNSLLDLLPNGLIQSYSGSGKDITRSIKMMNDEDQRNNLIEMLRQKNKYSSQRMLLAHLLTVSPLLNLQYAISKIQKRFNK